MTQKNKAITQNDIDEAVDTGISVDNNNTVILLSIIDTLIENKAINATDIVKNIRKHAVRMHGEIFNLPHNTNEEDRHNLNYEKLFFLLDYIQENHKKENQP